MTHRRPLQVAIAEDSAVFRTVLRRSLGRIPDVRVVGTATNGREAVELVERARPDILLLDVGMPVMTGPEALAELRRRGIQVGVIVISASDLSSGGRTVQLLRDGALDFILKPRVNRGEDAAEVLLTPLLQAIETFRTSRFAEPRGAPASARPAAPFSAPVPLSATRMERLPTSFEALVIGVSTGGPAALARVLPELPKTFPVPVYVVQHMPPRFTEHLARSLDRDCELAVSEAVDGEEVTPGRVVIAKGDQHMKVRRSGLRTVVTLNHDPAENSCRPSVDVLFRSAAETYQGGVLTVILTGMGSDGLAGVRELRRKGGYCIAQEQASCAVYGMPRAVIEAGEADEVLALDRIGLRIPQVIERARTLRRRA